MHPLIQEKRADIAALCRRYRVRHLEVFGSAARSDDFDPANSDADFLVEFEPESDLPPLEEFFGFQANLSMNLPARAGSTTLPSPPGRRDGDEGRDATTGSWPQFAARTPWRLSRLLERPVDLVEARAVRNPYVLANINRTREVVYAA